MTLKMSLAVATTLLLCSNAFADPASYFAANGFTQFQNNQVIDGYTQLEDYVGSEGRVYPGWGGQAFDAEYLFYKQTGTTLYLGLQTGFDLSTGNQQASYYSGDLALKINSSSYNYAIDFGFAAQKDYYNTDLPSTAGLYAVTGWNTGIAFTGSSPFAMATGTLTANLIENTLGTSSDSYYRIVAFNLTSLNLNLNTPLDIIAHWTMSCGNDAIDGSFRTAPVPEPATMLLFGTGLMGLAGIARRRRNS